MQDEQKKFQEKLSELLSYARDHENNDERSQRLF